MQKMPYEEYAKLRQCAEVASKYLSWARSTKIRCDVTDNAPNIANLKARYGMEWLRKVEDETPR